MDPLWLQQKQQQREQQQRYSGMIPPGAAPLGPQPHFVAPPQMLAPAAPQMPPHGMYHHQPPPQPPFMPPPVALGPVPPQMFSPVMQPLPHAMPMPYSGFPGPPGSHAGTISTHALLAPTPDLQSPQNVSPQRYPSHSIIGPPPNLPSSSSNKKQSSVEAWLKKTPMPTALAFRDGGSEDDEDDDEEIEIMDSSRTVSTKKESNPAGMAFGPGRASQRRNAPPAVVYVGDEKSKKKDKKKKSKNGGWKDDSGTDGSEANDSSDFEDDDEARAPKGWVRPVGNDAKLFYDPSRPQVRNQESGILDIIATAAAAKKKAAAVSAKELKSLKRKEAREESKLESTALEEPSQPDIPVPSKENIAPEQTVKESKDSSDEDDPRESMAARIRERALKQLEESKRSSAAFGVVKPIRIAGTKRKSAKGAAIIIPPVDPQLALKPGRRPQRQQDLEAIMSKDDNSSEEGDLVDFTSADEFDDDADEDDEVSEEDPEPAEFERADDEIAARLDTLGLGDSGPVEPSGPTKADLDAAEKLKREQELKSALEAARNRAEDDEATRSDPLGGLKAAQTILAVAGRDEGLPLVSEEEELKVRERIAEAAIRCLRKIATSVGGSAASAVAIAEDGAAPTKSAINKFKKKPTTTAASLDEASGVVLSCAAEAQHLLANLLVSGFPGLQGKHRPDYTRAFALYSSAARAGHPDALFHVGLCHEQGAGTVMNSAKAVHNYRKAGLMNHPGAMFRLGMALLHGELKLKKNSRDAVKWLRLSCKYADERYPQALYELALLHDKGVPHLIWTDHAYLIQLLTRGAELGHSGCQRVLGDTYARGRYGCDVDPERSIYYYTLAAENGEPEAMFDLGGWYLTGATIDDKDGDEVVVLPQSDTEARRWVSLAADAGLPRALYALGYFIETGIGETEDAGDMDIAQVWYRKAAEAGDGKAIQKLKSLGKDISRYREGKKGAKQEREWMRESGWRGLLQPKKVADERYDGGNSGGGFNVFGVLSGGSGMDLPEELDGGNKCLVM